MSYVVFFDVVRHYPFSVECRTGLVGNIRVNYDVTRVLLFVVFLEEISLQLTQLRSVQLVKLNEKSRPIRKSKSYAWSHSNCSQLLRVIGCQSAQSSPR